MNHPVVQPRTRPRPVMSGLHWKQPHSDSIHTWTSPGWFHVGSFQIPSSGSTIPKMVPQLSRTLLRQNWHTISNCFWFFPCHSETQKHWKHQKEQLLYFFDFQLLTPFILRLYYIHPSGHIATYCRWHKTSIPPLIHIYMFVFPQTPQLFPPSWAAAEVSLFTLSTLLITNVL